jgi:hypothetical protein
MADTTDQTTTTAEATVPQGLLEELTRPGAAAIRPFEVARGRQAAVERAFDDGAVVDEIASQLLLLSARG